MRRISIPGLLILILALVSCKEGSFYAALGDQISTAVLSIAPTSGTIASGASITFSATGGTPPYTFSILSGPGSIIGTTGAFSASAGGIVVIRVTDKNKKTSDATITVTPTGLLAINPSPTINVNVNTAIQFVAVGGTGPYHFTTTNASGHPSIDPNTGLYVSGFTTGGFDTVTVTDSTPVTPQVATAKVNVTATPTNVDYTITTVTTPAAGKGGMSVPGGYSFTVKNIGVAGGSQALNWWVFISDTTLNAAGTQVLASSLTGSPLVASGTVTIPITGTWPVVPIPAGATKNIYVMVAAVDDLNSANNISGPFPVVLSPPSVDYTATAPTHAGSLVAGGLFSESFTLQNIGTDAGGQSVHWTVYVSSNNAGSISGLDTAIAAGTNSPLGGTPASSVVNFSGTWPTAAGACYLKVQLSAADDINPANDIQVSTVYNTTYVDYKPVTVQINAAGQVAGGPLSGEFMIQNLGTANGTQNIAWTAYVSPTPTLASALQLMSGSTAGGVNAVTTSAFIPFSGNWPATPGTYYLIVTLSSPEDVVPGNNTAPSASGYVTTPPNIDYTVSTVSSTGAQVAAGPITGTFTLLSVGTHAGAANVYWTAYVSTDSTATIDAGATVIASGMHGPLGASPSSAAQGFTGTWPSAHGSYYLKVKISAADDINAANDIQVSGIYNTTYVDLTPPAASILPTGSQIAGGPLTGKFEIQNLGTANTTQPIPWTAYVAPVLTPTLVTYVASGSFAGPVNATTTSAFIPFAGTWPTTTGTYVLVVTLSSPEDVVPANNTASSVAGYGTTPPNIDYAVSTVSSTGAQVAAGAITGTFTIQSVGNHAGAASIYWTAYVSTDSTATIDAGATVIASGINGPLGASPASTAIGFTGTWPSAHGPYYLKVKISAADDINAANDVQVSAVYNTTYVDLTPPAASILPTGGQVAGGPLNGEFKIQNLGTANTTQPIPWTAYVAPVLTPTVVTYVASGSFAGPVNAGTTSAFIPFAGTWPTATGTWVLVVTLSSPEDVVPGNNTASSVAGYGTVPPNIDYMAASVSSTGAQVAAGPIIGTFTIQSVGTSAGGANVYWTAYVSTDSTATIDAGAVVIASGMHGPLGASPASTAIGFTGTWPSAHGPYYLKVKISAADDINAANDVQVSGVYNTTYVDLTPPASFILPTGSQIAGGPLTGKFEIQNLGTANTTQPIPWTAYVAPVLTPTLVTYVASGSFAGPVNAGTTSAFIPFAGTWPTTMGTYVLVVTLSSPEDVVPGNNTASSVAGYGTSPPSVDYAVSLVTNTGGATAPVLGPLTGSFHLANNGLNNGTQYVSWAAYASESGAVDSSAVLVATGTTPPLVATGSISIPFGGQWPIHYGNYQLVVSVSVPVDVDTNLLNNVAASGSTAAVGFFNEVGSNDTVATAQNLGLTLQPGMSVLVTRLAGGADLHDVFAFNTGTAASVSLYMSWSGSQTVTLSFYKDSVTQVPPSSTTVLGASDNLTWTRDAATAPRWIDVQNLAGEVPYTLIITAN